MANKSNLDVAYEIVKATNGYISFHDLWSAVASVQGFSEDDQKGRIGKFYTNLLLDGRFVNLGDNKWDLRERNTFETVHIDMKDCYTEEVEEDKEEEAEELEERKALGEVEEDTEESQYQQEEQE